jgi:hypothetical protein
MPAGRPTVLTMIELEPLARQILGSPTIAQLATLMPDGSPHSAPLWLSIEGDHLAVLIKPDHVFAIDLAAA